MDEIVFRSSKFIKLILGQSIVLMLIGDTPGMDIYRSLFSIGLFLTLVFGLPVILIMKSKDNELVPRAYNMTGTDLLKEFGEGLGSFIVSVIFITLGGFFAGYVLGLILLLIGIIALFAAIIVKPLALFGIIGIKLFTEEKTPEINFQMKKPNVNQNLSNNNSALTTQFQQPTTVPTVSSNLYCGNCGNQNSGNFCKKCGNKLN